MHPRELLEANLGVVERAIAAVCAHSSLHSADAADFASVVKLALIENDYAILRKWERRSSFATYITIVVRRLLVDHQRSAGRWYASAAARRQGEAAVLLERLLTRDARAFDEAAAVVRAIHPELTAAQLATIAASLPDRAPRPRLVAIDAEDEERFAAAHRTDERVVEWDNTRRAREASRVVRAAMQSLTAEDRVILRMRFGQELAISDIARALGIPQRPLYRRLESLLATLRRALAGAGLDAIAVADLIGTAGDRFDFDLRGKTHETHPSIDGEGSEVQR